MKATTYNIITLFSLLTLFLVSTSCTDELATVPGPTSNGQTPRFIIRANSPQTRVSYGSITQSTFEEGDVLGAFVLDQDDNIVINSSANITYSNIQYQVVGNASDGTQTLEPVLSQDALPYGDGTYHYIFYYPFREGTVYDNVTHTVQTARVSVLSAVELRACVQLGEHHFHAADLKLRMLVHGDASPVVAHPCHVAVQQFYGDGVAVAVGDLVHAVVDDLPKDVMHPLGARGADVHTGTFPHRVQPFEDAYITGIIPLLLSHSKLP